MPVARSPGNLLERVAELSRPLDGLQLYSFQAGAGGLYQSSCFLDGQITKRFRLSMQSCGSGAGIASVPVRVERSHPELVGA